MKSVVIGGYNPEFSSASVLYAAGFDTGWFPLHDKDPVDLDQNGNEDYYLVPAPLLPVGCKIQKTRDLNFDYVLDL
jgi:hypothetical protein